MSGDVKFECWCGARVRFHDDPTQLVETVQHGDNPEHRRRFSRMALVQSYPTDIRVMRTLTKLELPLILAQWFLELHIHERLELRSEDRWVQRCLEALESPRA